MRPSPYVIDVTDKLDNSVQQKLRLISHDLLAIKTLEPRVRQLLLRGGAVVDLLFRLEPNDFDLFYSFEEGGKTIEACRCDEVRKAVDHADFKYFDKTRIDLENSYEKEPKGEPLERTCDLISFHKDYISMFVVDEEGRVWTNIQSWDNYMNRVYEVRYEGFLPWAYFPHENDVDNYYSAFARSIVRGVGYIAKRNLSAGESFKVLLAHTPYYFDKTFEQTDPQRLRDFALSKIGSYEVAEAVVERMGIANTKEVTECLGGLF